MTNTSERKYTVCGLGNAIMDLQLRVSEQEFLDLGIDRAGMRLVDLEEQENLLRRFEHHIVKAASGGSATNTIIAMAQLGAKVAYGCCVGNDEYGQYYLRELRDLGVACEGVTIDELSTGTCVVLITPDAERTMNTHLGASAQFATEHVSTQAIADAQWLYIEGYLFSTECGQDAVKYAIRVAQENNVRIAVSFSDGFIVEAFRQPLLDAVEAADLVFANMSEAQHFVSCSDQHEAFDSLKKFVPNVVMTMKDKGARVCFGGEDVYVEGFPVEAVDETGAGDMFAGAFLYGITHGHSVEQSAKLGCLLASRVVTQFGPRLEVDPREIMSSCPEIQLLR